MREDVQLYGPLITLSKLRVGHWRRRPVVHFTSNEKENSVKSLIDGELKTLPKGLQMTPKGFSMFGTLSKK